jgi:hypothetical protein
MKTLKLKINKDALKSSITDKYAVAIKRAKDGKEFFLKSLNLSEKLVFTDDLNDAHFFHFYPKTLMFAELACVSNSDPNKEVFLYSFREEGDKTNKTKALKISKLDL